LHAEASGEFVGAVDKQAPTSEVEALAWIGGGLGVEDEAQLRSLSLGRCATPSRGAPLAVGLGDGEGPDGHLQPVEVVTAHASPGI
jgi:hypothetical protein